MGCNTGPFTRYQRRRPSVRTDTNPTVRSTARCFDTWGWLSPSRSTRSPTVASFVPRASSSARRLPSATALNASVVVGRRATTTSYSHMSMCQPSWPANAGAAVGLDPEGMAEVPIGQGRQRTRARRDTGCSMALQRSRTVSPGSALRRLSDDEPGDVECHLDRLGECDFEGLTRHIRLHTLNGHPTDGSLRGGQDQAR
jgi:hypothetical protein